MKRILLCCSAGMTARMVVNKMKISAHINNINVEITSLSIDDFDKYINQYDCLLIGPQVKYKLESFISKTRNLDKPIKLVDSLDYSMMDGNKILSNALNLLN